MPVARVTTLLPLVVLADGVAAAAFVAKFTPLASTTTILWMRLLVSVGAVVTISRFVAVPKACALLRRSTEPPATTLLARLANVRVAAAVPALLSVMVFPPCDDVRAPNWRAEAAVPLATKVKLPFTRFMERVAPPIRVVAVPVSSTFNNALFWTVMFPPVALKAPEPLMLNVPWLTAKARPVVCTVVQFSVPVPTLAMVTPEVPMLPLTLMIPVPTVLKVGLFPRARLPMFSVAPLAAPKVMPVEPELVTKPTVPMEFTPLKENTPPVLLIPEAPKAPTAMSMAFATVTPPDR